MSQIALAAPMARVASMSQPRPALRLTRRGRFVLVVLPLTVLLAFGAFLIGAVLQPANASSSVTGPGASLQEVTVMKGDTLWGIAREFSPERDARDVVAEISQLNSLNGPLRAGQTITVPSSIDLVSAQSPSTTGR